MDENQKNKAERSSKVDLTNKVDSTSEKADLRSQMDELDQMIDVIHRELQAKKKARNAELQKEQGIAEGKAEKDSVARGGDGQSAKDSLPTKDKNSLPAKSGLPTKSDLSTREVKTSSTNTQKPLNEKSGQAVGKDIHISENDKTRICNPVVKPNNQRQPLQSEEQRNIQNKKTQKNTKSRVKEKVVYFDDIDEDARRKRIEEKKAAALQKRKDREKTGKTAFLGSAYGGVIKLIIYIVFVATAVYFLSSFAIKVGNDVFAFVKTDVEKTVLIPIKADIEDIAEILYENDIIEYPKMFTLFSKFRIKKSSSLTGEFLSGAFQLNPMMSYDKILNNISFRSTERSIVRITVPEGLTVNEVMDLLLQKGISFNREDFIDVIQNYEFEYRLIEEMGELSQYRTNSEYSYRLEGYLFPDTYDFYTDESVVSIINKMILNFENKFEESFYERAKQLKMSADEIVTLASLIEKEAGNYSEFPEISSVFHNRLNNSSVYPNLESDATIQYAYGERKSILQGSDTKIDHPYNTYRYRGLPPGPIANPGIEAIVAALYPSVTDYYYFVSGKGETRFSKTYEQHQRAIDELLKSQ